MKVQLQPRRSNTPPITDSDLETLAKATTSKALVRTHKRPFFYRRSETALAMFRCLIPPNSIALFTPAIEPPRKANYGTPQNPFYALGQRLYEYGYTVNHTNFSITSTLSAECSVARDQDQNEVNFTIAHRTYCASACAIIVVVCETDKVGVGTLRSQLDFANRVQREIMERVDGSGCDVPMVIVRIYDCGRSRKRRKNGLGQVPRELLDMTGYLEESELAEDADCEDDDGGAGGRRERTSRRALQSSGLAVVENYDIEVNAGKYDELEMDRIVDLICRGR